MNFATSAAAALALSFLFYDQKNLHDLTRRVTVDITREGWEKRNKPLFGRKLPATTVTAQEPDARQCHSAYTRNPFLRSHGGAEE